MTDNNKQQLQEEHEDAKLRLLMEAYVEAEGEALWQEFLAAEAAGEEDTAEKREDRMSGRGSKGKNRRTNFLKCFGNGFIRAAVIFLVLIVLLSPLALSTEAFKVPVLNYIVAIEKKFSAYDFGENMGLTRDQEDLLGLIHSVTYPDEHQISHYQVTPDGKMWIDFEYDKRITMKISVYPPDGQISIDTENVEQISMQIQDYEAIYIKKDGHRIMWMDGKRELIFDVHAYELEEGDFWRYIYRLAEKLSQ